MTNRESLYRYPPSRRAVKSAAIRRRWLGRNGREVTLRALLATTLVRESIAAGRVHVELSGHVAHPWFSYVHESHGYERA